MIQRFAIELMSINWWFCGIAITIMAILLICIVIRQQRKWKHRLQNVQEQTDHAINEARSQADLAITKARNQAVSEVKSAQDHAQIMINEEKQRSKEAIQAERERIDVEKVTLEALGEKELMLRTVMALGGYGARLDRIEGQVSKVLKNTSEEMHRAASSISSSIIATFNSEVSNLLIKVESLKDQIELTRKTTIEAIAEGNPASTTYDDDDLMSKLCDIQNDIGSVEWDVSSAKSTVESIRSDVDSVKSTVESVQSDVSSLEWKISST